MDKRRDTRKEAKSSEVSKLKSHIRRLEKQNRDLISEVKTMEKVLEKNMKFLKGSTEDCTVEDLIEAAKESKTLKEVQHEQTCPKCGKKLTVLSIGNDSGRSFTCKCGYRRKM